MPARPLLIVPALLASSVAAAPVIDPQFGTHAVIQRGKPIVLSGSASPNERLQVSFAGEEKDATADASGRWQARFAPHDAGGPFTIGVSGSSGQATAQDVAIGDVWLCSGQSNMEYPLRRALNGDGEVQGASDPQLRLMKVEQQLAPSPARMFAKAPAWQPTTPDSAKDFSAACYFMVRELRASEKVPIGAIDDTWGGTPIRRRRRVERRGRCREDSRFVPQQSDRGGATVRRRMGRLVAKAGRRQAGRGTVEREQPPGLETDALARLLGQLGSAVEGVDRLHLGTHAGDAHSRRSGPVGDAVAEQSPDGLVFRECRPTRAAIPCRRACSSRASTRS